MPLTLYDTRGLELDNDSRLEVYKEVANFAREMHIKGDDENLISSTFASTPKDLG